uniref:Uncharacterized protein n=1 Tax=Alexandrium catenella TaxID=2925 RepID=A0A7S1LG58_ALECA
MTAGGRRKLPSRLAARGGRSRTAAAAVLVMGCSIGAWQALAPSTSPGFLPPGLSEQQRAAASTGLAALLLAGQSLPVSAEEPSLAGLEAKLGVRAPSVGIRQQKVEPKSAFDKALLQLEEKDIQAARKAEDAKLRQAEQAEEAAKKQATIKEREERAAIERREQEAKAQAEAGLKAGTAEIEATEKAEIEAAKKLEKAEIQAARDAERKKRKTARGENGIQAAEAEGDAAVNAAAEKAEQTIIAAKDRSEQALKAALLQTEKKRELAGDQAEVALKKLAERTEQTITAAVQTAEREERAAVAQEEQAERDVIQAVGELEQEELAKESAPLEQAKAVGSTVLSVALPLIIPGLLMMVYAFTASLSAGPPEPALGGETEETRKAMGRKPRPDTAPPTLDPWDKEPQTA